LGSPRTDLLQGDGLRLKDLLGPVTRVKKKKRKALACRVWGGVWCRVQAVKCRVCAVKCRVWVWAVKCRVRLSSAGPGCQV